MKAFQNNIFDGFLFAHRIYNHIQMRMESIELNKANPNDSNSMRMRMSPTMLWSNQQKNYRIHVRSNRK